LNEESGVPVFNWQLFALPVVVLQAHTMGLGQLARSRRRTIGGEQWPVVLGAGWLETTTTSKRLALGEQLASAANRPELEPGALFGAEKEQKLSRNGAEMEPQLKSSTRMRPKEQP